ncbi:MAG TPA: glucosamine 6-phosphate synthetase, partial [Ignavibacteria bacterium]
LGENLLETTNFKTGFCGIKPKFGNSNTYSLSLNDKFKMIAHYGKQYLINPAYINSSLFDTLDSFKSYYLIQHKNLNIYNYIKWDEKVITDVLINEYNWETDPGTRTTWRIGDGTAAFYNYIYYMVAGFTENDTFRSNQIREEDLVREEALELSKIENKPRWDSIQWYCRTIGIDFNNTLNTINQIPSLF